ncbi:uncharacterized protein LOC143214947 [Lasioglossum baleicum]|uniref:uncharacterized protein LOC143214947 n=1 Tax=Lasioglossum baleicum TaxID=434251 RepID=UPI003FCCB168
MDTIFQHRFRSHAIRIEAISVEQISVNHESTRVWLYIHLHWKSCGGGNRIDRIDDRPVCGRPKGCERRFQSEAKALVLPDAAQVKMRCYSCSNFGHISKDCKMPRREKGACFKCGEQGHVVGECKNKQGLAQVKMADAQRHALQESQEFVTPGTSYSTITSYPPPAKKKKAHNSIAKQNELLQVACDYLSQSNTNNSSQDDEYLNIAKIWANKLKTLEPMQKRLAEKAIYEILFEAEMETLHRDSVQINQTQILPGSSVSTSSAAQYFANYTE